MNSYFLEMIIKEVEARSIVNSNGEECVEVSVNKKFIGSAGLDRFNRFSVTQLPKTGNVAQDANKEFNEVLKGLNVSSFEDLNEVEALIADIDNSAKFNKIGGNAILALESALIKGMSNGESIFRFLNPYADDVPQPIFSCIGRSLNYNPANDIEMKEILVMPNFESFDKNVVVGQMVHRKIGERLRFNLKNFNGSWISDRGFDKLLYSFKYLIQDLNKELDGNISLGVSVGANHLFDGKFYVYKNKMLARNDQIEFVSKLVKDFDIEYIEDPLEENDFSSCKHFKRGMVSANYLLGSNVERFNQVKNFVNTIVVKPTQIGSLVKTRELINNANEEGLNVVLSESSGETMDTINCHLSVAWNVPYVKLGLIGKERRAKINEFKEIETNL